MGHAEDYLREVEAIAGELDAAEIERMAEALAAVRERGGRLFILGVGGGAGHASHAVNDFRKLCGIESYAPTDNVSELTARTNDEGWETSFEAWLRTSRLRPEDALLVFSVGGGSRERNVSMNLVRAIEYGAGAGATVTAIVGRSDGTAAQRADVAIVVPAPAERLTPHVESFQAVIWHLLVSHPALATSPGKWESLAADSPAG
jgi:D-sedoheptulose 7-phosphate isomerase